ncbi:hypothetical protein Ari01nite_06040 [Paractinoplanes rishiriensis]|uniref:Uncharacterized protein n=1 Tax=Paractinoplanes rishiriensis TaxID=1050105 RepID=A0A919JTQ3_9ACTN|nr:hypothetical protein Ari01nite_06040 [Actinoplanes rishiriensis]
MPNWLASRNRALVPPIVVLTICRSVRSSNVVLARCTATAQVPTHHGPEAEAEADGAGVVADGAATGSGSGAELRLMTTRTTEATATVTTATNVVFTLSI